MEYTTTNRGALSLIYNGYGYYKKRENKSGEVIWWRSKSYNGGCLGKVIVKEEVVLREEAHECIPDVAKLEVKKAIANAKKRVRQEDNITVAKIYKEELEPLQQAGYELVTRVPQFPSLKSTLFRLRNVAKGVQKEPENRDEVVLDQDTLNLSDGSSFLIKDDTDGQRLLIFATTKGKQVLEDHKNFFFDGTFKSCSKQFAQIFSIHADLGSTEAETNVAPIVFALLPNKTKDTYVRLLKCIKEVVPQWNPDTITSDFEAGIISAAKEVFPTAELHGCLFHFSQCNWRKIQELGLSSTYKNDAEVRQCVRMCVALAFLKPEDVEAGWIEVHGQAPANPSLHTFFDYFVQQWLENENIPIKMWNCFGKRHRTNNHVEGWNSRLNHLVRPHPRIRDLISKLKEEAESSDIKITRMLLGLEGTKRSRKYCSLQERINRCTAMYETSGDINRFLNNMAFVLKMD